MWDVAKAVLRGKFIDYFLRKEERPTINDLRCHHLLNSDTGTVTYLPKVVV